jgi:hypothetical protein
MAAPFSAGSILRAQHGNMDFRLLLGCLFFSLPLAGQQQIPGQPQFPGQQPTNGQTAEQDPDRPPQSPAVKVAELQRERARLVREIDYVKERVANAKELLIEKFANRTFEVQTIDAGASNALPAMAPPVARRHARLMLEDEIANYPENVLVVVNGNPITRERVQHLVEHQNPATPEEQRTQLALSELIRVEAIASEFADSDAMAQAMQVAQQVAGGKKLAELIPSYSTLDGAKSDGAIDVQRHSPYGLSLEQAAFDAKPGEHVAPLRHSQGIVLLEVDSIEKGASPEQDKVIAHALLVPYTTEKDRHIQAQLEVARGQMDIVVRDKDAMRMLPQIYRDPEMFPAIDPAANAGLIDRLRQALHELDAQISEASQEDDPDSKARVKALEERRADLQKRLAMIEKEASDKEASGEKGE